MPGPIPEELGVAVDGADAPQAHESDGTALIPEGQTMSSEEVAEFLNRKNREFNLAVKPKSRHTRPCYFPWYYIHINPDGTVFPCGCWFEFTTFGDFKTQTFKEIWTGPDYKELRRQLTRLELRTDGTLIRVSKTPDHGSGEHWMQIELTKDETGVGG